MASSCDWLTKVVLLLLILVSGFASSVSSFQFQVGGEQGWTKPNKNQTETYNDWATMNRFHVGDSLYFKYKNDSVLVVNHTSYNDCIVSNPITKYEDGETVIEFNRYGFFYFISGNPGHCKAGQKLVIRVMVHPAAAAMAPEPAAQSPGSDGGDGSWDSFNWGPPSVNSTIGLSLASYFMTALGGVLVILYLLM
ncbi:early nodulin-like protein 1 [Tripterygium wilfordii]|uniref:early nodulin-like protein 1 n=1 Tax=Tripterygium wilfordii TaxID=458696 RepID=UPI0018F7F869|nr:early nodulin-like protein 1 [Tripterygium wilfordii]